MQARIAAFVSQRRSLFVYNTKAGVFVYFQVQVLQADCYL